MHRCIKEWTEQDWSCWTLFNDWYGDNIRLRDIQSCRIGELMEEAFFAGFNIKNKLEEIRNDPTGSNG